MMTFRPRYFAATVLIFAVEVLIALYLHDSIIRPYVGDVLVVILIYAFARSFIKVSVDVAAVATLVFAFFIEFLQYLNIVEKLGLGRNKVARVVIGTSFSWTDIAMYLIGIAIVFLAEYVVRGRTR